MLLARYFPLHLFAIQYLLNFVCFQAGNEAPVILSCSRSATWGWEYGCKMKYFPICFLLLMTCLVRVENVPIPGDCTTKPYREKGGKNENQDGRLHLDCTLSAINSESEKTNFSVIPGEHTASLTVRCSDTLSTSHIEPQGKLFSFFLIIARKYQNGINKWVHFTCNDLFIFCMKSSKANVIAIFIRTSSDSWELLVITREKMLTFWFIQKIFKKFPIIRFSEFKPSRRVRNNR